MHPRRLQAGPSLRRRPRPAVRSAKGPRRAARPRGPRAEVGGRAARGAGRVPAGNRRQDADRQPELRQVAARRARRGARIVKREASLGGAAQQIAATRVQPAFAWAPRRVERRRAREKTRLPRLRTSVAVGAVCRHARAAVQRGCARCRRSVPRRERGVIRRIASRGPLHSRALRITARHNVARWRAEDACQGQLARPRFARLSDA